MKMKLIISATIALMSTQAFCADLRDASFENSSKASKFTMEQGQSTLDETIKIADVTAEKLKALISKNVASTARTSAQVGRAIINISDVSKPVFRFTGDGLAMVFKLSGQTTDASLDASKKLIVLLDPTSDVTGDVLSAVFKKLFEGSEISSDVYSKIAEQLAKGTEVTNQVATKIIRILANVFEAPLDLTSNASEQLSELLTKGSVSSSKVTTKIVGKENIEAGFRLTGDGISLTSKGVGAVFYVMTKGVTGISQLFQQNKEEIQKAVERNDQDTLAGLRELIRAEIENSIEDGDVINQLLSDADLDHYIELRLAVTEE